MKSRIVIRQIAKLGFWVALVLNGAASGQTNLMLWQDASGSGTARANDPNNWGIGWGNITSVSYDPAHDAAGKTDSGSMKIVEDFSSGGSDAALMFGFSSWGTDVPMGSLSNYMGIAMDILWDTNSTVDGASNWCTDLELREEGTGWSGEDKHNLTIVTNPAGWRRYTYEWPPTFSVSSLGLVFFYNYQGNASGGNDLRAQNGHSTFWVDNVQLVARTSPPPPPPTMSIASAQAGLNLSASVLGEASQRQNVRSAIGGPDGNNLFFNGWYGSGRSTTSFTIKDYPDSKHSGFEFHVYFVPNAVSVGSENAPDWNEPTVACLRILNDTNGNLTTDFSYKTNSPNGYGGMLLLPAATLAAITSPQTSGTWTLVESNDADNNAVFTLSVPGASPTNFVMSSTAAAQFGSPMYTYFGIDPAFSNNLGQTLILRHLLVTNDVYGASAGAPIVEDDFTGENLDLSRWDAIADPGGVTQVPEEGLFWLYWTLPDNGFEVVSATDLDGSSWSSLPLSKNLFLSQRRALVLKSLLRGTNQNYFRLVNTDGP